jgi:NADH-quinone oxidoreductase subunit M
MVLASLLLKLGGYGIIRICCGIFPLAFQELTVYIVPVLLLSLVASGLIALIQLDAKKIIAYSSIAHMSASLLGVCYLTTSGFSGAVLSMFAHGFTSPALVFLVGSLYDRYHTRNTLYFGGLSRVMPIFSVFLFIYTLSNMSFPGFLNFIGEINIFLGLASVNFFPLSFLYVGFLLGVLIVTAYSLVLFSRLC